MTTKNGDLPAMPIQLTDDMTKIINSPDAFDNYMSVFSGLTKREMFALHAAPIIYNLYSTDGTSVQYPEWRHGVVVEAVRLADLLLDELERTK